MTQKSLILMLGAVAGAAVVATGVVRASRQGQGIPPQGRGGQQMPSLVATLDTDRDGVISATEIEAAPTAIKTLDANKDGMLSGAELPGFGRDGRGGRGGENVGPRGGGREGREGGAAAAGSPDDITDTLMAFDKNGDGKLAKSEVPERFQGLFDRSDANKDGEITREELKQSATSQAPTTGGDRGRGGFGRGQEGRGRGPGGPGVFMDPVMAALDANRDGALSAEEVAAASTALRTLDLNRDGRLTADETRPPFGRGRRSLR